MVIHVVSIVWEHRDPKYG